MGLDVGLNINGEFKWVFTFEDDGCYDFFALYFQKMYERSGICISQYDDVKFHQGNIDQLEYVIADMKADIDKMPESWDMSNGKISYRKTGMKEEVFNKVNKHDVKLKIDIFSEIIKKVKIHGCVLEFHGD